MKMVDILLTILTAYIIIVVFVYPVTSDHPSHHVYSWCDCSTFLTASVTHTQSLKGAMDSERTKNSTAFIKDAAILTEQKMPKRFKLGPTFLLILIPILPSSNREHVLIRETW